MRRKKNRLTKFLFFSLTTGPGVAFEASNHGYLRLDLLRADRRCAEVGQASRGTVPSPQSSQCGIILPQPTVVLYTVFGITQSQTDETLLCEMLAPQGTELYVVSATACQYICVSLH